MEIVGFVTPAEVIDRPIATTSAKLVPRRVRSTTKNDQYADSLKPVSKLEAVKNELVADKVKSQQVKSVQQSITTYFTSGYGSVGCCAHGSSSSSSSESSNSSSSHHDHDHCKTCDGELTNGKCPPCSRRIAPSVAAESLPIYIPPIIETPSRPRTQPSDNTPARFYAEPPPSIIMQALEKGYDRIPLLGGLFIYYL